MQGAAPAWWGTTPPSMDMDVDRLPPNNLNLASSLSPSTHHRHPVRIRLTANLFLDLGESSFSLGEWVLAWAFSPAFSGMPPAAMDAPPPTVSCGLVLVGPQQIRAHWRTG